MKDAPQRRGNRPRPGPDLHDAAVLVVPHHHAAGVARQAAGRFRGNARPALEDGLPGLVRVGQRGLVDVHHDLVPLARGARIEPVVQGRLREQGQRVRLLLSPGRVPRQIEPGEPGYVSQPDERPRFTVAIPERHLAPATAVPQ